MSSSSLLSFSMVGGFLLLQATLFHLVLADPPSSGPCPRPKEGSDVVQPANIFSSFQYLDVHMAYQNRTDSDGNVLFCYMTDTGDQAPTLRVRPGDHMVFTLRNDYAGDDGSTSSKHKHKMQMKSNMTACGDTVLTSSSTNVHFHGSHTSPTCHQDEVIETIINAGETFTYDVLFPENQPPGLYWYHPHVHGYSEAAVQGGASGTVIVEGIENVVAEVGGLPEQIFVFRDILIPDAPSDAPAWDVSVNYVPIKYPKYQPAQLQIKPSQKQFWRVLNAGADVMLNIQLQYDGVVQPLQVVSVDGVPLNSDEGSQSGTPIVKTSILLPPAGRAEFIIVGPSLDVKNAQLLTLAVDTGPDGDADPERPLFALRANENAPDPAITIPLPTARKALPTKAKVAQPLQHANITRLLYFSEEPVDPTDPNSDTKFYVTKRGDAPMQYAQGEGPSVVTVQGSVEDWVIENRSGELHEFHIHQLHFVLLERNGVAVSDEERQYMDTVNIDYWTGSGSYPSVKLRLDFTNVIPGEFVYHCHILEHEDKGMMAVIKVLAREQ